MPISGQHYAPEVRDEIRRRLEAGELPTPLARALGLRACTVQRYARELRAAAPLAEQFRAAERGELGFDPVLPGFAIRRVASKLDAEGEAQGHWVSQSRAPGETYEVPAGHVVKGESTLVDADGRTIQRWVRTREGSDPLDVVAAIKSAFDDYPGRAAPAAPPAVADVDLLALLPCADWHLGMFAWGRETGGTNWDLKIAEETIGRAVEEAVARTPACGHAVVLGGGDLLHADNQENRLIVHTRLI